MNLLALETKFKELEQREKEVRKYFDPRSKHTKKHPYITDIRADFQYDNLLYGMGLYMTTEETSEKVPPKEPEAQVPKPTALSPTATKKSNVAKRRQPEVFEARESISKDKYVGAFAHTKIVKPELMSRKVEVKPTPLVWRSEADDGALTVSNPAATEEIRYTKPLPVGNEEKLESRIKQAKADKKPNRLKKSRPKFSNVSVGVVPDFNFQDLSLSVPQAPPSFLHEIEFNESNTSLKLEMAKRADHEWEAFKKGDPNASQEGSQIPKPKESSQNESSLEFRPGYFMLQIKLSNIEQRLMFFDFTAIFTDISDLRYPQHIQAGLSVDSEGFTWFGNSTYFDPLKHFHWVKAKELANHTLRVQLIGFGSYSECLIDRFVHFGAHTEEQDAKVATEIQQYEDFLLASKGHDSMTRTQKLLNEAQSMNMPSRSVFRYLKEKLEMKMTEPSRYDRLPSIPGEKVKEQQTTKRATPLSLQKGENKRSKKSLGSMGGGFKAGKSAKDVEETKKTGSPLKNPMTSALYKFREESSAFRPNTYSANLQIYQEYDLLESKYPPVYKPKEPAEVSPPVFILSGQSVQPRILKDH